MQFLRQAIRTILCEGILEDVLLTYKDHPKEKEIEATFSDLRAKVKPTYFKWIAEQIADGAPADKVTDVILSFPQKSQKLKAAGKSTDLFSYKTLDELLSAMEETGQSRREKTQGVKKNADVLHEDAVMTIVLPHDTEASCYYGKGTKWCTAATKSLNRFKYYSEENVFLYYVSLKGQIADERFRKISFGIKSGKIHSIFDAENKSIHADEVRDNLGEAVYNKIWQVIDAHASSQTNTQAAKKWIDTSVDVFTRFRNKIRRAIEGKDFLYDLKEKIHSDYWNTMQEAGVNPNEDTPERAEIEKEIRKAFEVVTSDVIMDVYTSWPNGEARLLKTRVDNVAGSRLITLFPPDAQEAFRALKSIVND